MPADEPKKPRKAPRPRMNTREKGRLAKMRGCLPKWIFWIFEVYRIAKTAWDNRPR